MCSSVTREPVTTAAPSAWLLKSSRVVQDWHGERAAVVLEGTEGSSGMWIMQISRASLTTAASKEGIFR